MQEKLWPLVTFGFLVEYAALLFFTRHYARLAFIPHVRRHKRLTPPAVATTYRQTAIPPITLKSLGLDGYRCEDDETVGGFEDGRGWLRLKQTDGEWSRAQGVVGIRPRVEDNTLHFEARLQVPFIIPALLTPVVAALPRFAAIAAALVTVFILVVWLGVLREGASAALAPYFDALERRAEESLERAGAGLVTSDHATLRHD